MTSFKEKILVLLAIGQFGLVAHCVMAQSAKSDGGLLHPLAFEQVRIEDPFWSPKFHVWNTQTVYDVLDKLEGKYNPDRQDLIDEQAKMGRTRNAFQNFDWVATGKKDTGVHDGPPWYDGLVYETIRGAADLLVEHPDAQLEKKIDGYIDRIAAAQDADPDGYLNTYTTLERPTMRWGTNGGQDRWQHDVYNAGMLMEAGVHYYHATGKTKLLDLAVKLSNYMCREMGFAPKLNIIPAHAGPEEALLKVYQLFKAEPQLKQKMSVPVHEDDYLNMVKFWIEQRGHYGGTDQLLARGSDSAYNQDHMPVLQQTTIEGHAVRATLLATAVAAMAQETKDPRYVQTAHRYWNNMIGKRLFITGGQGAIAEDERFGPDYFLPESAYLETCASIGSGFFSEKMNELDADGKYMDELERVIYNNLLSGVSIDGTHFHYENPLVGQGNKRWAWHSCPCCPPMILKMVGALPQYIYAYDDAGLYVNLFIGSEASFQLGQTQVLLKQTTAYPWKGLINLEVNPAETKTFAIRVRIPGWAVGKENPFDLYRSHLKDRAVLKVNGQVVPVKSTKGYAVIERQWKKGDVITLDLPMEPRWISTNDAVETVKNKWALAAGPLVYGFETVDNPTLDQLQLRAQPKAQIKFRSDLFGGMNTITGKAMNQVGKEIRFTAIPFFALGNREPGAAYRVWLPRKTN